MGRRMDGKVARSFEAVVEERFGPPAAEWGMAGPERHPLQAAPGGLELMRLAGGRAW